MFSVQYGAHGLAPFPGSAAASTTASDVGSTRRDAGLDHAAETGSDVSDLLRAIPRTACMGRPPLEAHVVGLKERVLRWLMSE